MKIKVEITILTEEKEFKEASVNENVLDISKDLNYSFEVCKEKIIEKVTKRVNINS